MGAIEQHERRGVGLLGVLGSLLTMALLAGVVIPGFFNRPSVTLDNAAILLANDLRVTQNRASHLGRPLVFHFDEAGYRVTDSRGRPAGSWPGVGQIDRAYGDGGIFEGVEFAGVEFGKDRALTYTARGEATREGSLKLLFRGEERRLYVERKSGRIHIVGLHRAWADTAH